MSSLTIEVLYPEFANLFGEGANPEYLVRAMRESGTDVTVLYTALDETPRFLSGDVDFAYLGSMTENAQRLVADTLQPYRQQIFARIKAGQFFLATGNAVEIFSDGMISAELGGFEGLGLIRTRAHLDVWHRHNSFFLGEWADAPESAAGGFGDGGYYTESGNDVSDDHGSGHTIQIVGFKSQFGHSRSSDGTAPQAASGFTLKPLFRTVRGVDFDGTEVEFGNLRSPSSGTAKPWGEGVRIHNFMGTYLTGPLLILNPPFTKWLMRSLGVAHPHLPFEEAAFDSYHTRIADFHDPARHAVLKS